MDNNSTAFNNVAKPFGVLPNGKQVNSYTIANTHGISFTVINYGATITSLNVPNSKGEVYDIVLGFDTLEGYIDSYSLPSSPYFGAIMGRYAGRIRNGKFGLNGTDYTLNTNLGEHHLHGGNLGFGRVFWEVTAIEAGENPYIKLKYVSPDGEENFPGELTIEVKYTLTEGNEIVVEYEAISDKDTIINLTQHSYYNLEGHKSNVVNQDLQLFTHSIVETDELNIPTGNFIEATQKGFDFKEPAPCPQVIDTSFVLTDNDKPAAILRSKKSGLKMTVHTNQPSVHIYVGGNCFGKLKGKEGADYNTLSGICFETQNFPDAPNRSNFPSAVLRKGEKYNQKSIFKLENI